MTERRIKEYVTVTADFGTDGRILPREIRWEDGRIFSVDRILDIRPASSLRVGGAGLRYRCLIQRQETDLFLEDGKVWFVERKCITG